MVYLFIAMIQFGGHPVERVFHPFEERSHCYRTGVIAEKAGFITKDWSCAKAILLKPER